MLFEVVAHYPQIVLGVRVERFRWFESAHELRATITLRDGSMLYVRDYLFRDGTRKYVYHWQSASGRLRRRWDNTGHWPDVVSHPHHVHVGASGNVRASSVRDLAGALTAIASILQRKG